MDASFSMTITQNIPKAPKDKHDCSCPDLIHYTVIAPTSTATPPPPSKNVKIQYNVLCNSKGIFCNAL